MKNRRSHQKIIAPYRRLGEQMRLAILVFLVFATIAVACGLGWLVVR